MPLASNLTVRLLPYPDNVAGYAVSPWGPRQTETRVVSSRDWSKLITLPRLPILYSTHTPSKQQQQQTVSTRPGFESIKSASEKSWTSASMLLGKFWVPFAFVSNSSWRRSGILAFWDPCWAVIFGFIRHQSLDTRASYCSVHHGSSAAENLRSSARRTDSGCQISGQGEKKKKKEIWNVFLLTVHSSKMKRSLLQTCVTA